MRAITRYAPAKINLGLHVLRKREDGYHEIETVFLPIGWTDRITVEPGEDFFMTCSDDRLPTDERNLCMKAARKLAERVGDPAFPVHLHLEKHIPFGAGLGGGSSDAVAAMQACAACWDVDPQMDDIALSLGADVSFFLDRKPARARGIGEHLEPLPSSFSPKWTVIVAVPDIHVSTADAYAGIVPNDTDRPDLMELVARGNPASWRDTLKNDFEQTVMAKYPDIATLRDAMYDNGAFYAAMSGSGSAVYGLFEPSSGLAAPAYMALRRSHAASRTWMGTVTS